MRRGIHGVLLLSFAIALASAGCGKGVNEARPLTVSMDDYKTAAVDFDPKSTDLGEKATPGFVAYLETRLKGMGAFEPAPKESAQMIIRVRPGVGSGLDEDLHLAVDLVDTKTRQTVGQLQITASAPGGKAEIGLRKVAEGIAQYIRDQRRAPLKVTKGNSDVTASPLASEGPAAPPPPGVVVKDRCTTTCKSDSTSMVPPDDLQRVAERLSPTLGQVRVCLDRVSAQNIEPTIIVRFESAGQMISLKLDAGGYDELACIVDARSRVPALTTSRAASLRCEHRCQR
ncbi:MAG: hypothetical protein JST00_19095 [Deltaproteobacteria bacterium]|nr:hypothetical protein [Deltaproteobacteria bacterium]